MTVLVVPILLFVSVLAAVLVTMPLVEVGVVLTVLPLPVVPVLPVLPVLLVPETELPISRPLVVPTVLLVPVPVPELVVVLVPLEGDALLLVAVSVVVIVGFVLVAKVSLLLVLTGTPLCGKRARI